MSVVALLLLGLQYPAPLDTPPPLKAGQPQVQQEPGEPKAKKPGKEDKQRDPDSKKPGKKEGRYDRSKKDDPRSWWNQMNEEQREQAKLRWKRYREMSPESKAEMERRLEMLKRETEQMMLELPAEEREALSKMTEGERDRKIRKMLRKRLKEKADLDGHPLSPPPHAFDGQPLEERLQGSKEHLEAMRLNRLQHEVDRAVHEGWLGPRAAEFYRTLPPDEVEKELMRFHKWRVLDHFNRNKRWKELGIDNAERKRITALPPEQFMEHMRQYRPKRGEGRKDGRGFRGGRRGDGEGFNRQRGEGEGRPRPGDGRRRPPKDGGEKPDGSPRKQPKRG